MACDPAFEQNTTVSQSDRDANPPPTEDPFATESSTALFAPVTPATLFEHVTERARSLAEITYAPPDAVLPAALERMDYEQYQSIRFRPEAALWQNETPFEVQLFHPGSLYRESVRIHLVHDQQIAALRFDKNRFRYDGSAASIADLVGPELGYAGFRIHYPLKKSSNLS